jgi:hypothetical protein
MASNNCGVSGAAAESLFMFKGKFWAVLINYPSRTEKDALVGGDLADTVILRSN